MTEIYHQIESAIIPLAVKQGVSFYHSWIFRYKATGEPFPLFTGDGVALWKGRCMIRENYDDVGYLISLTSEVGGLEMVFTAGSPAIATYGIILTAVQTASLPRENCVYDIEFERLSDGWVIRPQSGPIVVEVEATK